MPQRCLFQTLSPPLPSTSQPEVLVLYIQETYEGCKLELSATTPTVFDLNHTKSFYLGDLGIISVHLKLRCVIHRKCPLYYCIMYQDPPLRWGEKLVAAFPVADRPKDGGTDWMHILYALMHLLDVPIVDGAELNIFIKICLFFKVVSGRVIGTIG